MKKITFFMMAAFLFFSINSFSQVKPQKTTHKVKTEQIKKKNSKAVAKSKKSKSKRRIHKPKSNRQGQKILK
jgi:hypothetical protein